MTLVSALPARPAHDDTPRPTLVLLGASNMTRGLGVLSTLAAHAWGSPIDVLAAIGLGRSYGASSRILGRRLPGVIECGLWRALDARPGPVVAIVGDVGNDLLYGYDTDTILRWVDECLRRLRAREARLLVTSLPPAAGEISLARFLLFRSVLFPMSRLRYADLPAAVQRLNVELRTLAGQHGASHAELLRDWYGFDPIHIRLRQSRAAWAHLLSALDPVPACPPVGIRRSLRTYRLFAEHQWLFGCEIRRPQPCLHETDGSTLSLY